MVNPYMEMLLATIIWSTSGAFVKLLRLPATSLSFFRLATPTLILAIFFLVKRSTPFRKNPKFMILASSLNAVRMFFYFVAYNLTSIGNAVIMLFTWPAFAVIFGRIFLKERLPLKRILLLIFSFAGIILVYLNKPLTFGNKDFLGMSAMVLSAVVYSLTVIIYKKESKNYSNLETVFWQNLVGAFVFLPFLFINKPWPTLFQVGLGSVFGIIIGIAGFGLFFAALKKLSTFSASILAYLEAVFAVIIGVIFFKEILAWNVVIGGVVIIISSIILKLQTTKV